MDTPAQPPRPEDHDRPGDAKGPPPPAHAGAGQAPAHAPPPPPHAPPTVAGDIEHGRVTPDATGGVIPYKNPAALIGYYVGIFGLVPALGVPLALAAVVLGVVGLGRRKKGLAAGGLVHAWVAIVLGAVSLAYHGLFFVLVFVL